MILSLWRKRSGWRYGSDSMVWNLIKALFKARYITAMPEPKADSIGRRNTLTLEVFKDGDEGLVGENERRT